MVQLTKKQVVKLVRYLICLAISIATYYYYPKLHLFWNKTRSNERLILLFPLVVIVMITIFWTAWMMAEGISYNLKLNYKLESGLSFLFACVLFYFVNKGLEKRIEHMEE